MAQPSLTRLAPRLWWLVPVTFAVPAVVLAATSQFDLNPWIRALAAAAVPVATVAKTLHDQRSASRDVAKQRQDALQEHLVGWDPLVGAPPTAHEALERLAHDDDFYRKTGIKLPVAEDIHLPKGSDYVRRDELDMRIRTRTQTRFFTLVIGESGSGKSRSAFQAAATVHKQSRLLIPVKTGILDAHPRS